MFIISELEQNSESSKICTFDFTNCRKQAVYYSKDQYDFKLIFKKNVSFKRPFKGVMDFYVFSASGSEEPAAIFWTEIKQKWKWVKRLLCPRDRLERLFLCVSVNICVILILCEHEYLWIVFSSFCLVNTIYCISCFQCMSIKKVIQAQFGDCSGYLMKASTD